MDVRHEAANLTNAFVDIGNRLGEGNYLYAQASKEELDARAPETFVGGQMPISLREPGEVFEDFALLPAPHWTPASHVPQAKRKRAPRKHRKESPPPESPMPASDTEYEVKAILDSQVHKSSLYYLVAWVGYEGTDAAMSWNAAGNLAHCKELVREFHEENPGKIGSYDEFLGYLSDES